MSLLGSFGGWAPSGPGKDRTATTHDEHGTLHAAGHGKISKNAPVDGCGKDGTDYAHGAITDPRNPSQTLQPFSCDEVNAIRARVAADITRGAMNPAQRALTWMQGRGGEYTDAAYQAAWAAPSDTPAQVDGAAR